MMTDMTNVDEITEEDSRTQLQERVAESLAELSEASDAPVGVQTCAPFTAVEVSFASEEWMSRLGDVQGWLKLEYDLSTTDAASFITSLAAALRFEPGATGTETVSNVFQLTETALERLSERAEYAARVH
ncbi:hypothetical protein IWX81_003016 [Salinibacterium sp. CAN_S4]|uniref:hypothetical protein n=1 Tax=Salinibacterium sp. CAN_S4 TaxID=2787727 RepID=UPI0018EFFA90